MKQKNHKILLYTALIALLLIVSGIVLLTVYRGDDYKPQENIYFLKYEGTVTSMTTVIFKYDQIGDEVVEIGILPGFFRNCVINEAERYITGIFSEDRYDEDISISVYDIKTGTVQTTEIAEEIKELASGKIYWGNIFFYDEGNKILLYYDDENEDEWWLVYDFTTGEYERIAGDEEGTSQFLAIEGNMIWYYRWEGGTVCQYDLETQTRIEMMSSVVTPVFTPITQRIAYKKPDLNEGIYLYDINVKESKCIAPKRINMEYESLHYAYTRWSSDGRQFFYIKANLGLNLGPGPADVSLMVYDAESGRRRCFYEEKDTTNRFIYVARR